MIRLLLAALALLPAFAVAQGVSRARPEHTSSAWCLTERTMTSGTTAGGILLDEPFRFTRAGGQVTSVSGGGAGSTVITLTDGTNTCTITWACTTTQSVGVYMPVAVNGAGTGCSYAAGATVTGTITTGTCTTSQPAFRNICFVGKRL